jgi:RNA polymerase sigma-70 factor (ECF subfamily)
MMATATEQTVHESVDHLFRRHAGQMVAVLSRIFGLERLDLIEDAVQDALISALKTWPFTGFPDNPQAWLIQVSKNRMLDRFRRARRWASLDDGDETIERALQNVTAEPTVFFSNEVAEDQLRMIFACCHPAIPPDAQVALTLKTVGGFGVSEIASAFLAKEDAVARMLSRAKQKLREAGIQLEIPVPAEVPGRLEAVLKVLYLMFNEGYTASQGNELLRQDLCIEAIRLTELLADHPLTGLPRTQALAALFLFQAARLSSRLDEMGELLLLSEQDRELWDKRLIERGMYRLRLAATGDELSNYHLEAEIAGCHTLATDFDSTDWARILDCYELLQSRQFSPIVELNRIIALSKIEGPNAGLAALNRFSTDARLNDYYLHQVTKGHFLAEIGEIEKAVEAFEQASSLTRNEAIRRFLNKKIFALN